MRNARSHVSNRKYNCPSFEQRMVRPHLIKVRVAKTKYSLMICQLECKKFNNYRRITLFTNIDDRLVQKVFFSFFILCVYQFYMQTTS